MYYDLLETYWFKFLDWLIFLLVKFVQLNEQDPKNLGSYCSIVNQLCAPCTLCAFCAKLYLCCHVAFLLPCICVTSVNPKIFKKNIS